MQLVRCTRFAPWRAGRASRLKLFAELLHDASRSHSSRPRPGALLKGPGALFEGPRGPLKGPRDPLKGSRADLKCPAPSFARGATRARLGRAPGPGLTYAARPLASPGARPGAEMAYVARPLKRQIKSPGVLLKGPGALLKGPGVL